MIRLCEPGGISVSKDGSLLYIADTNNHAVKALNLDTLTLHRVGIKFPGNYWDYWRGLYFLEKSFPSLKISFCSNI